MVLTPLILAEGCKTDDPDVEICEASSDPLDSPADRKQGQEKEEVTKVDSEEREGPDPVSSTVAAAEERSSEKRSPDPSSSPASVAGGARLTAGDVLARIFPSQRRAVLDLVLQACDGDVLKAIEHFLSLSDSIFRHQTHPQLKSHVQSGDTVRSGMQPDRPAGHSLSPNLFGSSKSAFTPLTQGAYPANQMLAARSLHVPGHQPPFPFSMSRDMLGSHFNPAVHFLLNQPATPFPPLPPLSSCPPGCTQCPPIPLSVRSRSESSGMYRGPCVQEGAVDLTADGQSSWRSSPSSSATSKRSE